MKTDFGSDDSDRIIDAICDRFEKEWSRQSSEKRHVEWMLSFAKEISDDVLREKIAIELIRVDIEKFANLKEEPPWEEYFSRVPAAANTIEPQDSFESSQVLTERYHAAPDKKHGQRPRYIGPYKLLQPLGEGGMGAVWMAEQSHPVERRVAVKIIRPGFETKHVIARFEAERQALAMMDHQNIAKVLDAGSTENGQPYFVMELVHGIPITKFCDKHRLSLSERLELFVSVCSAIHHAHQKGIMHRDIKPSNILVAFYEGERVAKVIDFGLAKALQSQIRLTDKTLFTEFGKILGTIQYMSPEQAEVTTLDVDIRTDVYSLGVLLYELLTGSTPLDAKTVEKNKLLQILEIVREHDPPKPSTRLSDSGDKISEITARRKTDTHHLSRILKGDLDWIVMKALEKDRTRRYDAVSALGDDVTRFLKNEPVVARPPSLAYRSRKFIKKHRASVTWGVGVASILILTITFTVRAQSRAAGDRVRRESADRELFEVKYAKLLGSHPSKCLEVVDGLDREKTLQRIHENFLDENLGSTAKLNLAIAWCYLTKGKVSSTDFVAFEEQLFQNYLDVESATLGTIIQTLTPLKSSQQTSRLHNFVLHFTRSFEQPQKSARAILLIAALGDDWKELERAVKFDQNPETRSWIIRLLPSSGIPPSRLIQWLKSKMAESDLLTISAGLLALGSYEVELFNDRLREHVEVISTTAQESNLALIRNSGLWLAKKLGLNTSVVGRQGENPGEWFQSKTGDHVFVVCEATRVMIGTPSDEDATGEPLKDEYGSYLMQGDALGFNGEFQQEIRINRRFAIGANEVTIEQFHAFNNGKSKLHTTAPFSNCPAHCNWLDAVQYCNWLSKMENLDETQWCYDAAKGYRPKLNYLTLKGYRLPTEAEWEFACRANTSTLRFYGDSSSLGLLNDYAWNAGNSENQSHPVALKKPNPFGLFDTLGNVWEWCDGKYIKHDKPMQYNRKDSGENKMPILSGWPSSRIQDRIQRGGGFNNQIRFLRCAVRSREFYSQSHTDFGFRVARTISVVESD